LANTHFEAEMKNMITERFAQALAVAIQAHDGQLRKGTTIPYISHPIGVSSIAMEYGADEDQAIAALLHDVLEDAEPQLRPHFEVIIKSQFGSRVFEIVLGCTDGVPDTSGEKQGWEERKIAYLEHLRAASEDIILVSGSDKLHNARSILNDFKSIGLAVFERFKAGQDGTVWYYQSLAKIFNDRNAPMASALQSVVDQFPPVKQRMC
jgi:GTP pyrophosphokinase